jgi:flagellin-like protein
MDSIKSPGLSNIIAIVVFIVMIVSLVFAAAAPSWLIPVSIAALALALLVR